MQTLDFLARVYGNDKGWVDIPSKVNGHWIKWLREWPDGIETTKRRIKSSMDEDLYFSCMMFSENQRRHDLALPGRWLFADLDLVAPDVCIRKGLMPTVCWESSPGHFQALWRLSRRVKPHSLEKMNRMLTYASRIIRSRIFPMAQPVGPGS